MQGLPWWHSGLRVHLAVQGTQALSLVWKIPYDAEQLSPYTTITKPTLWSHYSTREATAMRSLCATMKSSPHLPQIEKELTRVEWATSAVLQIISFSGML